MNSDQNTDSTIVMIVAGCAVAAVMAISAAMAAVRQADEPLARIGDIIAYNRAVDILPPHEVVATTAAGTHCVLDLPTIAGKGGSLVVEALADAQSRLYRLHWAGGHTAAPTEDCGAVADLLVHEGELNILASAAGGYGVDRKTLALGTPVNSAFGPN